MRAYRQSLLKTYKRYMRRRIDYSLKASTALKISVSENNSFSLPPSKDFACVGETKACLNCYAQKGRFVFDVVKSAYMRNWMIVKDAQRQRATNRLVKQFLDIIPEKAECFRVHVSGDFFNKWYVNVWAKVIAARPNTKFWTYTRSFNLDFTPLVKLSNFTLWASTDEYNHKQANAFVRLYKKHGVKKAYGPWQHNKLIPDKSFICPATSGLLKTAGACEKCKLCVVKGRTQKNVVFLEH